MIAAVQGRAERALARALAPRRRRASTGEPVTSTAPEPQGRGIEGELPHAYGHSRVVLLGIDPFHLHAYWEVTEQDRAQAVEQLQVVGSRQERLNGKKPASESRANDAVAVDALWLLRFHDVTGCTPDAVSNIAGRDTAPADMAQALGSFDIPVSLSARNWYVELWSAGKSYLAELGVRGGERFVPVCRSNLLHVPPADPGAPEPPRWQAVALPFAEEPEQPLLSDSAEVSKLDAPPLAPPIGIAPQAWEWLPSGEPPGEECRENRARGEDEPALSEPPAAARLLEPPSMAPEPMRRGASPRSQSVSLAGVSASGSGSAWLLPK